MNQFGFNIEHFVYGNIVKRSDAPKKKRGRKPGNRTKPEVYLQKNNSGSYTATKTDWSIRELQGEISVRAAPIHKNVLPIENVFKKLRETREFIGLTRPELSILLSIPESTIENHEMGGTRRPSDEALMKYSKFINLIDFLKEQIRRKFAIRALFSDKLSVFGGKNAVEFADRVGNDAIDEINSAFHKMYK